MFKFQSPKRRISFDIVTLFVFFIAISSLTILLFNNYRNYKGILLLSDAMIAETNEVLLSKIQDMTSTVESIVYLTKGMVISSKDVNVDNKELINDFRNTLKYNSFLSSIFVADEKGNLIQIYDVVIASIKTYYNDTKPLPSHTKYAMRVIDHEAKTPSETWVYLDNLGNVLDTQVLPSITYNPIFEKWYKDTVEWPRLHWSDVGRNVANIPITTISTPIEVEGRPIAVVGVNLPLNQLSNFISYQKIARSGRAFILKLNGEMIIPTPSILPTVELEASKRLISRGFEQYLLTKKHKFLLEEGNTRYFVNFSIFPLSPGIKWLVAITVPFDDFFGPLIKAELETIYISIALIALIAVIVFFASRHISEPIVHLAKEVDSLKELDFSEKKPIVSNIKEIITLGSSVRSMRSTLKAFGKFVPKEIVKTLIQQGKELTLGGERKELTILFTDIANFTTASESLLMEELTQFLTLYFDHMSRIILEHGGTIDKYIGDSLMAFWGAPEPIADHADKACEAALFAIKTYARDQKEKNLPPWRTRIGINTGEVVVGNIGTTERMSYSAIGNPVNLAARLQGLNKEYHTTILISESVHEKIGTRFVTRPLDFVEVKGKKNKVTIYELVGSYEIGEISATEDEKELCVRFSEAYGLFHQGKVKEAKTKFLGLYEKFKDDGPLNLYLERLKEI